MSDRAKRIAKYFNQCKLPKWATVLGVVLLALGIVAAGVTAIFHDKYLSIFGAWESALTNVWFIAFLALMGVGALISLGYPLLTLISAWIWALFSKPEPEVVGPSFFSLPVTSMPPPPSRKTAEAADPLPTRTGAVTKTRTTSSGPAAAFARRGRWLLRL